MIYHPIQSSSITVYGYDEKSRIMEIAIKGETYHYFGVDPAHHREMLATTSPGGYFNAQIKPRHRVLKQTR
jgi:hypothetical protein